jgi:AhpD family alkylhydroperoxidase
MESRIQIDAVAPAAFRAMYALEKYLQECQWRGTNKHLVKIRASQLNGCAFCIDMHTREALKAGEIPKRIFLLDAWRETDVFSEEEKVILQLTEEVTLIHRKGVSTETYQRALQILGEQYLAQLIMAITTINAWNRISISTNKPIGN